MRYNNPISLGIASMTSAATTPANFDPANIGPEDLWAVWIKNRPLFQMGGAPPVEVKWFLAAPGKEGFDRLAEGWQEAFLAAFPLSFLRQLALTLPPPPSSNMPKWVQVALGTENTLILVRDTSGNTRVVNNVKEMKAGETEILSGNRSDFDAILNEGNHILNNKDLRKITGDDRPFVKQGEMGWLDYQQDPIGAAAMDRILKRVKDRENSDD